MKLFITFLQGFMFVIQTYASVEYFYPPVIWQKDSCPFSKLKGIKDKNVTKEFFMKVLPYTGMNIICPNELAQNTWGTHAIPTYEYLYENLWQVNKESYDKCEVNKDGKLLLVCDNPKRLKRLQFSFHPIFSPVEPRFIPGKHYYFLTTSRGIISELTTRKQGGRYSHCVNYHLKLHIYVCDPRVDDCIWEQPKCDPPAEIQQRMLMIDGKLPGPTRPLVTRPKKQTRKPTTKTVETTTMAPPTDSPQKIGYCKENETSVHIVMNFVLGGVIAFLIIVVIILSCALSRKCNGYNPEKASLPPLVRQQSKQTVVYESVPVQLPPVNMVPIGSPQSDYLIYTRTSDPTQHTVIRTPHHNYETPVFKFPEVPKGSERSRAGSTHVKSSIERDDNMDSVSV